LDDAFACFFLNERALCTISINIEGEKTGRKSWEASYTEETTENEKRKKKGCTNSQRLVWQNHLNYSGSSAQTITIPAQVRRLSLYRRYDLNALQMEQPNGLSANVPMKPPDSGSIKHTLHEGESRDTITVIFLQHRHK
jgi:hypothetical protein